jgi:AcrR family transcriptional regulator
VSAPAADPSPRDRLLAAVVEHVARHGLADLSLRSLAAAVGTSHRMLIYHFGSKEGLLAEVVASVEAGQRVILAGLAASDDPPALSLQRFWDGLADESIRENVRLFFDVVAQALQDRPGTQGLRAGLVEPWLDVVAAHGVRLGLAPDVARVQARLGMAVTRGLLLDLLATGDREGVDAAMAAFIAAFAPPGPPDSLARTSEVPPSGAR